MFATSSCSCKYLPLWASFFARCDLRTIGSIRTSFQTWQTAHPAHIHILSMESKPYEAYKTWGELCEIIKTRTDTTLHEVFVCGFMYVCMYMCIYACVYMSVCMYVCMYVCKCVVGRMAVHWLMCWSLANNREDQTGDNSWPSDESANHREDQTGDNSWRSECLLRGVWFNIAPNTSIKRHPV